MPAKKKPSKPIEYDAPLFAKIGAVITGKPTRKHYKTKISKAKPASKRKK